MDGNANKVIGTAALITVGVGTLNSFYKNKKPPSMRFLIGSGATYVILSAIGEGEPDVAKALALAVATTVVIGDGGGVLSYLSNGEIDTTKPVPKGKANPNDADDLGSSADIYPSADVRDFTPESDDYIEQNQTNLWPSSVAFIHPQVFVNDTITAIPGV